MQTSSFELELKGSFTILLPRAENPRLSSLGMKPGPAFKGVLDAAMDEQLEGKIRSKEEAVAWAKAHIKGDDRHAT